MKNTLSISHTYNWWGYVIGFVLSTANPLYVGWFGTLMLPLLGLAILGYITPFIFAPPVDIDVMVYENLLLAVFFMGIILLQEQSSLAQMQ